MALSPELAEIKDLMDKSTGDGRDHASAVAKSEEYVRSHPDLFTSFQGLSLEDCVNAVTVFRNAGMEEEHWRVEVYLLAKFEPQDIGGEYHPVVRFPEL